MNNYETYSPTLENVCSLFEMLISPSLSLNPEDAENHPDVFYGILEDKLVLCELLSKRPMLERLEYFSSLRKLAWAAFDIGDMNYAVKLRRETMLFRHCFLKDISSSSELKKYVNEQDL